MKSLLFCLLSAAALPVAARGRAANARRAEVGELWRTMLERNHTGGGK